MKVMIVDDDKLSAELFKKAFIQCGVECTYTCDSTKAVHKAEEELPDLIIMDSIMPQMSGFEVSKALKLNEKTKEIPIVFVSADISPDSIIKCMHVGCVDFIPKPVNLKQLVKVLISFNCLNSIKRLNKEVASNLKNLEEKYRC